MTVDVDTIYHGFDRVLATCRDYLGGELRVPSAVDQRARSVSGARNHPGGVSYIPVAAMTLGALGALARVDGRFIYSPAFVVNCADTTGCACGDVFHGAFCLCCVGGRTCRCAETLEFSNAMAAMNCTALGGARRHFHNRPGAGILIERGERRSHQRRFRAVPLEAGRLNDSPSILRSGIMRRRPSRWS